MDMDMAAAAAAAAAAEAAEDGVQAAPEMGCSSVRQDEEAVDGEHMGVSASDGDDRVAADES